MDTGTRQDLTFGRDGNGHRWSGWPGAVCLYCHREDQNEIALADGATPPFPDKNSVCPATSEEKELVDRDMNPEAFK